jgi:hypothetical protein
MTEALHFYFFGSLRVTITFAMVFTALILFMQCARRLNLFSANTFQVLGPAIPFSLLVASVTWSFVAAIEYAAVEDAMPAWMIIRVIALMPMVPMVALVMSPITILLGIPTGAVYFLSSKKIPPGVIYLYVAVVMSLECIWYAKIIDQF